MLRPRHLLVLSALLLAACGVRKDAALLEDFKGYRQPLDQLVTKFREDPGLAKVTMITTLPEDPTLVDVTFDRLDEYRALCKQVEAEGCIEGYDAAYELLSADEAVDFDEEKTVIWIHPKEHPEGFTGRAKGYLYSENPPFPVVPDLDEVRPSRSGTWVRHIEGPWYLYFEYRE
jgi:hypothetical protein